MADAAPKTLVLSSDEELLNIVAAKVLRQAFLRTEIQADLHLFPHRRALIMSNSGHTEGGAGRIRGIEPRCPYLHKRHARLIPELTLTLRTMAASGEARAIRGQVLEQQLKKPRPTHP